MIIIFVRIEIKPALKFVNFLHPEKADYWRQGNKNEMKIKKPLIMSQYNLSVFWSHWNIILKSFFKITKW